MFGKFFSNKSSQKTQDSGQINANVHASDLTVTDKTQVITETLKDYRSANFPQGIFAVSSHFHINAIPNKNQTISVDFVLPFPCQGELGEIAVMLADTLKQPVEFSVQLNVKAVRSFSLDDSGNNIKNIIEKHFFLKTLKMFVMFLSSFLNVSDKFSTTTKNIANIFDEK